MTHATGTTPAPTRSEKTSGAAHSYLLAALCTCALLLAAFVRLPYGFYVLLRVGVCISSIYLAIEAHERKLVLGSLIFAANAVLFNPLFPVRMRRADWEVTNLITAGVFGVWLVYCVLRDKPWKKSVEAV